MKVKQFIKKPRKAGVEIIEGRGKGGHVLAKFQGKWATIPVHGDVDIGPIFLKMICKQLGLPTSEVM